ncbi:MAG: hypothetical protein ACUVRA_02645 [Candidatus Bathyarchaeaceae archaeon]
MNKRNCSGQVLLVGVLIIALLLLSTQLYVYDLGKAVEEGKQNSFSDFILAVRLGSKRVIVGSLANVSQGGTSQTLEINLKRWSSFVGMLYQSGKCILNFTFRETAPYSSGVWISWGTNGLGVSGAYADFTLQLLDRGIDVNLEYGINVTTTLLIQGTYKEIGGNSKQVNVTCNILNEGEPALAENIALYYKNLDEWLTPGSPNNYTIVDYGNGTYFMSFVADIYSSTVEVSVHALDRRGVSVQANITCTEI